MITPGVDTELFPPPAPRQREPVVLYVGRIETTSRWKGLDVLVDALSAAQQVPDATLDLVGDGDAVEGLRNKRTGWARRSIDWHGTVAHSGEGVSTGRVTVLPSLTESESFGMALSRRWRAAVRSSAATSAGSRMSIRDGVDGLLARPATPPTSRPGWATSSGPRTGRRLGPGGREAARPAGTGRCSTTGRSRC